MKKPLVIASPVILAFLYFCLFSHVRSRLASGAYGAEVAALYEKAFLPLRMILTKSGADRQGRVTVPLWSLSCDETGIYAGEGSGYGMIYVPGEFAASALAMATETRSIRVKSTLVLRRVKIRGNDGVREFHIDAWDHYAIERL